MKANTKQRSNAEKKTLRLQKKEMERIEQKKIIEFQFKEEIIKGINDFVNDINKVVIHDEERITLEKWSAVTSPIYVAKNGNFRFQISLIIVWEDSSKKQPTFKDKEVIAFWRITNLKRPTWMNIILCKTNEVYWEWIILHNNNAPSPYRGNACTLSFIDYSAPRKSKSNCISHNHRRKNTSPTQINYLDAMEEFNSNCNTLNMKEVIAFFKSSYIES